MTMRLSGRSVATLVTRVSLSWTRVVVDPHRCTTNAGVQLSRRLFSSPAGGPAQQQQSLFRAFNVWEQSRHSTRAIFIGVAASGCLGALMVAADAEPTTEHAATNRPHTSADAISGKPRVVVLGTGWASVSFLKELNMDVYDVQIVSPRNYFVFTPLLPSVTNGTVEARSISEPIRKLIKCKKDQQLRLYEAECLDIDPKNKRLICRDVSDLTFKGKEEFKVDYDYLVIGVGALANTFGTPGVEEYCHFLKEIEDAEKIRHSVVDCFETASLPHLTDDERRHMLSFLIVGGGPTGVEFAAELHDLVHEDLSSLYPHLQQFVSVTIIQSGDHILNTFDQRISDYAETKFQRDGLKVKTNCRVLKVNERDVVVKDKASGQEIIVPFGMAVWSTGLGTRPMVSTYMERIGQKDRRMLATDEWLRVKCDPSAWAIGDCATVEQRAVKEDIEDLFHKADKNNSGKLSVQEFKETLELVRERYPQIDLYMKRQHLQSLSDLIEKTTADGTEHKVELDLEHFKSALCKVDGQMKHLPATAQVAAQQGSYLAKCFNHMLNKDEASEGPMRVRAEGRHRFHPFVYKHLGQFAPLGTEQCGAELPGDWVSLGRSTQWLWYSVYASKQVSWRTRALVVFDWTKRLFFGRDSSRM